MKKTVLILFTVFCLLSALFLTWGKVSVTASPNVIYVPTNYTTIQEAINYANPGDTIFVYNGTYYEHIIVNKSVSLVGQERDLTIIDGEGTGTTISVTAPMTNISGFTIRNTSLSYPDSGIHVTSNKNNLAHNTITNNFAGIWLDSSDDNVVSGNNILGNDYGIYLRSSNDNLISGNNASSNNSYGMYLDLSAENTISENAASNNGFGILLRYSNDNVLSDNNATSNDDYGIYLLYSDNNVVSGNNASSNDDYGMYLRNSHHNEVSGNNALHNTYGLYLHSANNNTIYHNHFINNSGQVWSDSINVWDKGTEGNYWSDYIGEDLNGDGIGDTPYVIDVNNRDNYPLMEILSVFKIAYKDKTYYATTISNSTISSFRFGVGTETGNKIVSFDTANNDDTFGFCRIMIPTELMNYSYIVLVDDVEIAPTILDIPDREHAYLYFTYSQGDHTVTIISSELLRLYVELLDKQNELLTDFHNLNLSHYALMANYNTHLANYNALLQNYTRLLESYGTLNLSHQQHLLDYAQLLENYRMLNESYYQHLLGYYELQRNYALLLSGQEQNIRNITYAFIASTAILLVAAVYLSAQAHRKFSRN